MKIEKQIVGFKVKSESAHDRRKGDRIEHMHELVKRPRKLIGVTYKIKPPGNHAALYFTINDMVLNEGTDDEQRVPFEIFLNSKQMESYEWIAALTRIISATFRKGGKILFIIEELEQIFSPNAGYFGKTVNGKGKYFNSVVSEIGHILNEHFIDIGLVSKVLNIKEEKQLKEQRDNIMEKLNDEDEESHFNEKDESKYLDLVCPECGQKEMLLKDGCPTCLCGHSKCG